eukprot:7500982-Pyramimonas_sp.AAC.1
MQQAAGPDIDLTMEMESSQPDQSMQQSAGPDIDLTMEIERILEEADRQQSQTTTNDLAPKASDDLLRMDFRQDHGPA